MQNKAIYIVLTILIVSCNNKVEQKTQHEPEQTIVVDRKANFPKTLEAVNEFSEKENFWIFVMAGQSNMAGRGFVEPIDTIQNKRILSITKNNTWVYAKEPLNYNEPNLTGLDCGVSFANNLLKHVPKNVTIGLVHTAIGGSAVEQWVGDSIHKIKLLTNFKNRVDFAKQHGTIKGILWHQGESNAKPELIPTYEKKLDTLFTQFRNHIKNDSLPIIMGELGNFIRPGNETKQWKSINTIINNYASTQKYTLMIKTGDLKHKGDSLHFNSQAQRTMGKRYAEAYLQNN